MHSARLKNPRDKIASIHFHCHCRPFLMVHQNSVLQPHRWYLHPQSKVPPGTGVPQCTCCPLCYWASNQMVTLYSIIQQSTTRHWFPLHRVLQKKGYHLHRVPPLVVTWCHIQVASSMVPRVCYPHRGVKVTGFATIWWSRHRMALEHLVVAHPGVASQAQGNLSNQGLPLRHRVQQLW